MASIMAATAPESISKTNRLSDGSKLAGAQKGNKKAANPNRAMPRNMALAGLNRGGFHAGVIQRILESIALFPASDLERRLRSLPAQYNTHRSPLE
jgi:hypothetical protein